MSNSFSKNVAIGWRLESAGSNLITFIADNGQLSYNATYSGGYVYQTGVYNDIYHTTGTMSSGGTGNLNLQSLSQSVFGYTINKNLVNIRSFDIKNTSTRSGANLYIDVSSSSGFKEAFGYPTGLIRLGPSSNYSVNDYFRGWDVTSNAKHIRLIDGGSGVSYEMVIMGCSG